MQITELLEIEGRIAVELYRQSFIENDRVATGDTNKSIRYSVDKDTLTVYGRKDIFSLENGMTADEFNQSGATFSDINRWVQAKGLGDNAVTGLIMSSLQRNGWNNEMEGRNASGGTDGIITNPTNEIVKSAKKSLTLHSKSFVLGMMKTRRR